jgi:large subunit ribosomal protein L3
MGNLGLLGNKIGMTQLFNDNGDTLPVTVIKCGPCYVTQLKTNINHPLIQQIQIGYIEIKKNSKKVTKPLEGHFTKNNLPVFYYLKEEAITVNENYKIGQELTINLFKFGQKVKVSGLTIGKGNTGNIKQNHFTRGGMSHGSKHHRLQGSLGAGTSPGRVFPGKKMPGRVGMEHKTITGLNIVYISLTEHLIAVQGCLPGKIGNLVYVTPDK